MLTDGYDGGSGCGGSGQGGKALINGATGGDIGICSATGYGGFGGGGAGGGGGGYNGGGGSTSGAGGGGSYSIATPIFAQDGTQAGNGQVNLCYAPDETLTVQKTGSGAGTVTSNPAGIDCGLTCAADFAGGSQVTLTATASAGSSFAGWSGGGCSGTNQCVVTIDAAKTVTARFNILPSFPVTVAKAGTGSGTVTSSPSGIDCGATCSASYQVGTQVTLTPVAIADSTFAGWSGGGCSGTGTCVVTVAAPTTVTATFNLKPRLTVSRAGNGVGTVASNPSGISCGATCSAIYAPGTQVTLTATSSAGSTFTSWSGGGCSGTGTCVVTLSADTTVTATFTAPATTLLSSVLPSSRSVQVGNRASAFATVINTGSNIGVSCGLSLGTAVPDTSPIANNFDYQTTNPTTNARTGTANTPADIPAGGSQSFVFGITPSAPLSPTDVAISATCNNATAPAVIAGVNTLLLSASATPIPDIVALAATPSGDGIVSLFSATASHAFGVASVNVGASGSITVSADTGTATLPLTITLCQTDAQAQCTNPALLLGGPSVSLTFAANATPTFSVFIKASGTVANDPAVNRIFVRFKDSGGVTRGSTSVAVRTQ